MSLTLDCYKSILPAFWIELDDEHRLSQKNPIGSTSPLSIGGRRLVLPTKAWLKKGFGEDYLPFHPLCEVMSREGTSPVVQLLQRQAKAMISFNMAALLTGLMRVAVDKDSHKDLPIECTDFLKKLSNADKSTQDLLDKLIGAATKKNRLLTVYLKNGGKFDGKKVNRSAVIRFPIMEDLQSDSKDVLGITIPKKQRPTLIALFKLVLPFGDNAEEYSYGTTSRVAPYFTALLVAYHKIMTVLNQSINTYGDKLNLIARNPVELYPVDIIDGFSKFYSELPPLTGNEGSTKEEPTEASDTTPAKKAAAKAAPSTQVHMEQPVRGGQTEQVQMASPKSEVNHGKASMADFMAAMNPQPTQVNYNPPQQNQFTVQGFPQQNGFNNVSGYNPGWGGQQPSNSFAPAGPMTAPWEQQQMGYGNQQFNNNPFMAATRSGGNGGMGLL